MRSPSGYGRGDARTTLVRASRMSRPSLLEGTGHMKKATSLAVVVAVLIVAFLASTGGVASRTRSVLIAPAPFEVVGDAVAYADAAGQAQLVMWFAGEQRARDEAAEAQRVADEEAAAEAARVAAAVAAAPRPVAVAAPSGSCCTHSDAWWSGVASCEQGGRNDPYFGYFSFMDGSAGGKSWGEQVAMGNALLNRVGHEVGPWAAACVAAGYRSSPGG